MKLIIDIPDKDYEFIKNFQSLIIGGRGNCKTIQYNVINAIKNGTPYEERPKGEWELFEKRPYQNLYMCSKCGHIIESMPDRLAENFKGCYCGADMRGDV